MAQTEITSQIIYEGNPSSSYLDAVISSIQHVPIAQIIPLVLVACFVARNYLPPFDGVKASSVGQRSIFEPVLLVQLRFALGALSQINDGYQRYKDKVFRLYRNDRDILVIPPKYVEELQNLPAETLSSSKAVYANHVGSYAGLSPMLDSQLHSEILRSRLTPSIPKFVTPMESEVLEAISLSVPECEDQWVEVGIYDILLKLVTRVTNRVLLGEHDCYNEDWAQASMGYAANATLTIGFIRLFPLFMRPFVAPLLPPVRKVESNLQLATRVLIPIINQRREAEKGDVNYKRPDDFLQWMIDAAVDEQARPDNLARRLLIVFLGAAHTSTMAGAHVCYDLCAMPEYIEPLRAEISELLKEDGGWGPTTPMKMRKMDSFLRESQRTNPPSLLDFHRLVQKPITLSDGTYFPMGAQLCTASYPISQDPNNIANPQDFDGFRYERLRRKPDEENKHQFATTDMNHLHFGRGKYACPGRFFASAELKVILAHVIMQYDFKYPPSKGRPENLNADEFMYPDPSARLLIKRRPRN